jgi:hypothetical protein
MRFICESGHKFTYPAKLTIYRVGKVSFDHENDSLETSVCPICKTVTFEEYVEPIRKAIDQKDLDPSEPIKPYLDAGWEITAQYVKATRIVLYAPTPQQSEDKFTEGAKMYYAKLHPEAQP